MRSSYMEVNLDSFNSNIQEIKKYLGNNIDIMPVVKANGYGTHINYRVDILNKFKIVAVAICDEAEFLRKIGYTNEIFCLNQPNVTDIEKIVENNITIGISSKEFLKEVLNIKEKITVHLEIETGMGRTGISQEELEEFIEYIRNSSNIFVEGIYTHFSVADTDYEYTENQINKFNKAIKFVENKMGKLKYIHAAASNGILNFKNSYFNLVRPGIIIYGYESFEGAKEKINLKPVSRLISTISFIKTMKKGESISYGRKYIAEDEIKVATIPIGYADGIRREYFKDGYVVINNIRAKIIGSICMDSFMVDITNIPDARVGDTVYIWDNEIIKLDEIAKKLNTINYEIISTISTRVPRVFVKEGEKDV